MATRKSVKELLTKEFLFIEYVQNSKSYETIAKEMSCSSSSVEYWVKQHGLHHQRARITRLHDLTGRRFGFLTAVAHDQQHPTRSTYWICKCDCGETNSICASSLISGRTTSCGCWRGGYKYAGVGDLSQSFWRRIEKGASDRNLAFQITKEYAWSLWLEQNEQCALTGVKLLMNRNFSNKNREHTASLDRIDNSKGYLVGNVRWVHKIINDMRGKLDDNVFVHFCIAVAQHAGEANVHSAVS